MKEFKPERVDTLCGCSFSFGFLKSKTESTSFRLFLLTTNQARAQEIVNNLHVDVGVEGFLIMIYLLYSSIGQPTQDNGGERAPDYRALFFTPVKI